MYSCRAKKTENLSQPHLRPIVARRRVILVDCALGMTELLPSLREYQKPLRYSITLLQLGKQFAKNQQ